MIKCEGEMQRLPIQVQQVQRHGKSTTARTASRRCFLMLVLQARRAREERQGYIHGGVQLVDIQAAY